MPRIQSPAAGSSRASPGLVWPYRVSLSGEERLEFGDAADNEIGMGRQGLARTGAREHADREAGAGRTRHVQIVEAIADHGDRLGGKVNGAGEGSHHSRTWLRAMAAVIAAEEVEQPINP